MRAFIFFAIAAPLLATKCHSQSEIVKITYNTLSRGGNFEEIILTEDSVLINIEERRSSDESKILKNVLGKTDWQNLLRSVADTDVTKIQELPSPSNKRAYDGARHASLTIWIESGESFTHNFDDNRPHESLVKLMDQVILLRSKILE